MPIKNLIFDNLDFLLITYIIIARIFELFLSKKNTKNLLHKGAREFFPFHYNFIFFFHCILIIYFFFKCFENHEINVLFFFIFFLLQIIRFKVIYDLGEYWTTRIIVLESKKLVKTGIYKYLNHPNYLVVFFEVIFLCLFFKDYIALIVFTIIKSLLLTVRIFYEEKANRNRF